MNKLKNWWLDIWYGKEKDEIITLEKQTLLILDKEDQLIAKFLFKTSYAIRRFFYDENSIWFSHCSEKIESFIKQFHKSGFLKLQPEDKIILFKDIKSFEIIDKFKYDIKVTYRPQKCYDDIPYKTE